MMQRRCHKSAVRNGRAPRGRRPLRGDAPLERRGPRPPETLHITVVDGYERDACAWRRLGGRCALSASAGEAAALAAYAADLARPRDGRPYGKAAVLARDAAGAVAACVAPAVGERRAVCLFATRTEPRPLELRVLNDDGSVASSLRVAGAAPASLGDALVVRNDGYTRDVAGPTKAVAAVAACALAAADPADAPKLRDYGAWLHARRKFAVVRRDGDRPTAWVKARTAAPSKSGSSATAARRRPRRPGGPLSVLDLACGKGGDLSKWANAKPTNYVGVDIAKQSLDDAAGRLRGMGNKLAGVPCRLVEASLGNTSLVDGESAFATWDGSCDGGAWSSRPRPLQRDAFHVASMQFAIHYMFETRPRAEALFRDLGLALRAGGRFTPFAVGEGPWWRVDVDDEAPVDARKGLSAVAEAKAARAERRVLSVWLEDATYEKLRGAADAGDAFGLRYWFQLRDGDDALAVDSPEWLAPLPVLQELAQAAGSSSSADPFPSFLELRRGEDPAGFARSVDKMGVPDRAGSLSPAEWDVLSLYVALEFVKKADAPVAAAPDPFVLAFPKGASGG
ncbi:mRNA (guanine-N7-)-methyltransferase [Aureococcus anophagefferens]|nr:mRNA (guanine-N7-)-methyltransferase [Aureococcus anophagefferens]